MTTFHNPSLLLEVRQAKCSFEAVECKLFVRKQIALGTGRILIQDRPDLHNVFLLCEYQPEARFDRVFSQGRPLGAFVSIGNKISKSGHATNTPLASIASIVKATRRSIESSGPPNVRTIEAKSIRTNTPADAGRNLR